MSENHSSGKKDSAVISIAKTDEAAEFSPMHFRVSPDFHHEFKLYAVEHGISMLELLQLSFRYYKAHHER